jgi:hypothetical protein
MLIFPNGINQEIPRRQINGIKQQISHQMWPLALHLLALLSFAYRKKIALHECHLLD